MNVDQYISSGVLELYALHSLPPEEMRKVEDMVAQHPRIKDELEAIKEGLIKYAESYAPQPSEGLYDKIINSIHEFSRADEKVPLKAAMPQPQVIQLNTEKITSGQTVDLDEVIEKQTIKINRRPWFAAAAAVILLIVSASVNYYQYNQNNEIQSQLVALQQDKAAMASNNTVLQTKFDQTSSELKLYTDPHNKMVMMKGMPVSPASEVMVMWDTKNNDVYVDVHRLPTPPEGMQYQLWAIDKNGKPVDAGLLTPFKERRATGPEQMNKKIMGAVAFAITLEQKGGVASPTIERMYVKGGV